VSEIVCAVRAFGEGAMHTSSVLRVKTERKGVFEREREKKKSTIREARWKTKRQAIFYHPRIGCQKTTTCPNVDYLLQWATNFKSRTFLSIFLGGFELIEYFLPKERN
jgi:hypothetical protein